MQAPEIHRHIGLLKTSNRENYATAKTASKCTTMVWKELFLQRQLQAEIEERGMNWMNSYIL
jgi:hypothetical protein